MITKSRSVFIESFFQFHHDAYKTLSEVRVSLDHTVLYFPLKNCLEKVVGYRKLQAGNEEGVENFGLHTAGLFYCKAPKVGRSDQAIIVPSIQDILSLAAEKVPGKFVITTFCCSFFFLTVSVVYNTLPITYSLLL